MKSLIVAVVLWLMAAVMMPSVFADHSLKLPGHNPDRGYNQANCELMVSKDTGAPGEWMGHYIGCIIEYREVTPEGEVKGYVLIMEYKVEKLTLEEGNELRNLIDEFTAEDPPAPTPNNWIPV